MSVRPSSFAFWIASSAVRSAASFAIVGAAASSCPLHPSPPHRYAASRQSCQGGRARRRRTSSAAGTPRPPSPTRRCAGAAARLAAARRRACAGLTPESDGISGCSTAALGSSAPWTAARMDDKSAVVPDSVSAILNGGLICFCGCASDKNAKRVGATSMRQHGAHGVGRSHSSH